MQITYNTINLVPLPDEIILNICDKVSDLSDLLNLRLVSQQLNRVSSEPKLYNKFAKEFINLKTLNERTITEVFCDHVHKFNQAMRSYCFPNASEEEIDKLIQFQLNIKFNLNCKVYPRLNYNGIPVRQPMNCFILKIYDYLSKSKEIDVAILRSMIKKIDSPPIKKHKKTFIMLALINTTTSLEVFKLLIEELKCEVPHSKNYFFKNSNKEIKDYLTTVA